MGSHTTLAFHKIFSRTPVYSRRAAPWRKLLSHPMRPLTDTKLGHREFAERLYDFGTVLDDETRSQSTESSHVAQLGKHDMITQAVATWSGFCESRH